MTRHALHLVLALAAGAHGRLNGQPLTEADCNALSDCGSCAGATPGGHLGCHWCPMPGDKSKCHAASTLSLCSADGKHVADSQRCAALETPAQVHIAIRGETGTGMAVMWQTQGETTTSVVKYGLAEDDLSLETPGTIETYYDEGTYMHTVVLSGLTPATTYYYSCGDSDSGAFSPTRRFTTARAETTYPFVSAVFGDMGRAEYNAEDTINGLINRSATGEFDMMWHLGDVGYADDAFLHAPFRFEYEEAYDIYMNEIEPYASEVPLMVLPGNHEAECHSPACQVSKTKRNQLSNFSAYNARFKMPSEESGGAASMWYSFDFPPVHFVSIDTETDFQNAPNDSFTWHTDNGGFGDGDWTDWLEQDLASVDRARTPWVLVGGHRPVYTVKDCSWRTGAPTGQPSKLQAAVEDLFLKYNVDVYFSGHLHAYERQRPVYNNEVDKGYTNTNKPVYIVTGAAGGDEDHSDYDRTPTPEWNVVQDSTHFGYGILTVESDSVLKWVQLDSATETAIDTFVFEKAH